MLFIVATPIGNLEDITLRAIQTLREVDLILAEDTRHTAKLLQRFDITTPTKSYHQHSGITKIDWVVEELIQGKSIALVTDAGTPAISDPASQLVAAVAEAGIRVVPIPGASAVTALLSVAGVNADHFIFLGFLPKKKGRETLFKKMADTKLPMVIFESPMRIVKTLSDIIKYWGDRDVVVGRELTKLHEEIVRAKASEAIQHFGARQPKGEFVIVVN